MGYLDTQIIETLDRQRIEAEKRSKLPSAAAGFNNSEDWLKDAIKRSDATLPTMSDLDQQALKNKTAASGLENGQDRPVRKLATVRTITSRKCFPLSLPYLLTV
jgi:hypothetical protein